MNDLARFARAISEEFYQYGTEESHRPITPDDFAFVFERVANRMEKPPPKDGWLAGYCPDEKEDYISRETAANPWEHLSSVLDATGAPDDMAGLPLSPGQRVEWLGNRLTSLLSTLERIAIAANIGVMGFGDDRIHALCLISDTANKALAEQTTKTP